MDCEHLNGTSCQIASQLAGVPAATNPSACKFCVGLPDACAANRVTLSMALGAVQGDEATTSRLKVEYGHLIPVYQSAADAATLAEIRTGIGPGSQLWLLLESLGIRHSPNCKCLALAKRMNAWGPSGCRLARTEIVEQMRVNAQGYGWGTVAVAAGKAVLTGMVRWIDLADVYGSLVDEAIRRAETSTDGLQVLPAQT